MQRDRRRLDRLAKRPAYWLALAACAALGGCGSGGDLAAALGFATTQPTASPTPTATTPLIGDARKRIRIGKWEELIIAPGGTIDAAEYRRVAANYNSPEIMEYRLGPTAGTLVLWHAAAQQSR